MPYDNPGRGNPKPDYYDDAAPAAEPKAQGEMDKGDEKTGLLNKDMFGGHEINVGDEFVFEVVRLHDDQVEVKYATEGKSEDKGEEPMPEKAPMPEEGSMASMME
jgi:hypothetical protein